MKLPSARLIRSAVLVVSAFILAGCGSVMDQIQQITAFSKCQFRLASVSRTTLAGVPIQGGTISDLNLTTLFKLRSAFSGGSLPLQFTLNLEVRNPNASPAGLSRMQWTLLMDGNTLTTGLLEKPFQVGPNQVGTLPMEMSLDLKRVLSGKALDSMVNLAMDIAGEGAQPTRLTLQVKPSLMVSGQSVEYPGVVTVNQTFPAK